MKIIHLADVHFNKIYKGTMPLDIIEKISFDIWENFTKVCKYVKDENIDMILIAGDLFEREYFTLSSMNRLMTLLTEIKVPVLIVCGNHDFLDDNSIYKSVKLPDNIFLFPNKFSYVDIDSLKTRVFGISYDREYFKTDLPEPEIKEEYKNIFLVHGMVDEGNFLKISKDYAEKFDYVAMGHVHKRGKIFENTYYSGSLEPLSFKEDGDHGFVLVDFDKNEITFKNSQIKNFTNLNIDISPKMSPGEISSAISEKLNERDLFRVNLTGTYGDIDYLLNYLENSLDAFYFEIKNYLTEYIDFEEILKENKDNLLGSYISSFDLDNDLEKNAMELGLKYLLEDGYALK